MKSIAKIQANGALVAVALAILLVLVGGTLAAVKVTTDHLLDEDAKQTAQNWARLLGDTVTDLEQIAGGELPSSASMQLFDWARQAGQVFRYEIYNTDGFSQLVSEGGEATQVNISEFSEDAVLSRLSEGPIVSVHENGGNGRPPFYATAYVPVIVDGNPVAVVAAFVDQTAKRDSFQQTFTVAALSLCLLTGVAFGIPAVAWIRRTREKQQADRRIRFLAHHDGLTGLANRGSLFERLEKALAVLPTSDRHLALHFLDIDRFKEINDTLGHDAGDHLLKTVAERLRSVVRADDLIARIGGDEFVVLQGDIGGARDAEDFAERLMDVLRPPIPFREQEIVITGSVGVAIAPENGATPERLLKSADLALYKSKADGRNCIRFFRPEMDEELQARIRLEKVVRDAAFHNGFELHYQPVVQMGSNDISGYEALVRLPMPDGSFLPPLTFISVLEELRLIGRVGAWIVEEACRTAATWPEHLTVAVNLSPAQFGLGNIAEIVRNALQKSKLAPHRLELEITESLLLGDSEAVLAELQEIKAMGVAVVMDDFGTGYSSLSYLWRFPFDKIKIDQSFMRGFMGADGSGHDAATVIKTIIALGRELGMRVTVEGVETAGQVAFLDNSDADLVQGFFFGKAVPANEIAGQLLANVAKAAREERAEEQVSSVA